MKSQFLIIFAIFYKIAFADDLACYFIIHSDGYNCHVENSFGRDTEITSVNGTHRRTKSNSMVDVIFFPSSAVTEYLPRKSCEYFNNLIEYECFGVNLIEIFRENFMGCENLNLLLIQNAKFSTLPSDVFMDLPNLTMLEIGKTKLSYLPEHIFENNQKLIKIDLKENQLAVINAIFPSTVASILLLKNDCISKNFTLAENEIYEKCSNTSVKISNFVSDSLGSEKILGLIQALELSVDANKQQIEILKNSSQNIQRISVENIHKLNSIQEAISQTMQSQKLVAVTENNVNELTIDKLERLDAKIGELKRENENHQKRFQWNETLQYVSGTLVILSFSFFVLAIIMMKLNRRPSDGLLMEEY